MSVSTPKTIRSRTITHIAAAHQRIDAAAVPARAHVAARRPQRRGHLEDDLPEEQHERARDVEAVGEERAVARVRALLGLGAADREDRLRRPRRRAGCRGSRRRRSAARCRSRGGARSRRSPSGEEQVIIRPRLLLDPAERGDVLVGAEQDPGLAGAGLRREVGLPLAQPVAAPRRSSAPSSGALPSRMASRRTGSASPSISRKRIPGTSVRSRAPWRPAIRRVTRSVYSSSSLVPRTTCRHMLTAAMITIAASSASANESTWMSSGSTSAAQLQRQRVGERARAGSRARP